MNSTNSDKSSNGLSRFASHLWHIMIYGQPSRLFIITIGVVIVGVHYFSYLWHPESQRFQDQVIKELRSLPVPPDSTERDFSSGFQPHVGMAERKIFSRLSEKDLCAFYRPIMANFGWRLVQENCYPSSEFHILIEYQKGQVNWRIGTTGKYYAEKKYDYDLVSTWSR